MEVVKKIKNHTSDIKRLLTKPLNHGYHVCLQSYEKVQQDASELFKASPLLKLFYAKNYDQPYPVMASSAIFVDMKGQHIPDVALEKGAIIYDICPGAKAQLQAAMENWERVLDIITELGMFSRI